MSSAPVQTARSTRIAALIAAALVCAAALPASAPAAQRSYRAADVSGRAALFRTIGVQPRAVVRAVIHVGRFERRVSLRGVRQGLRRGRLRVHFPKPLARRLAARRHVPRARMPRLSVRYTHRAAPSVDGDGQLSGFETGDFSDFVGASAWTGDVSVTSDRAYEGSHSARGVFAGGESGAMRTWFAVDWQPGADVWYGLALYVQDNSDYCYWNPLRWDNYKSYGGDGDVGGLTIERGRLSLIESRYGGTERVLVDGGHMPDGRWVWLEVHQRLSGQDGEALSELYVDGRLRGRSAQANSTGRVVNHVRFGAVNVAGSCSHPGTIYFDRTSVSPHERGPLG